MRSSSACDRAVFVGWDAVVVAVTVEFGDGVGVPRGCPAGGWVRVVVVAGARVTAGWVCCCVIGWAGSEPDWSGQPSHALLFSDAWTLLMSPSELLVRHAPENHEPMQPHSSPRVLPRYGSI